MTQVRMRQSPSGKYLGDPPMLVGPGTDCIIARAQGSGTTQQMPASWADIAGLDDIPFVMRVGYLYEVRLETEVVVSGLLTEGGYQVGYVRHSATDGWEGVAHTDDFDPVTHVLPLMTAASPHPAECDECIQFVDVAFGVHDVVAYDAIKFRVLGSAANSTYALLQLAKCRAIITEYLP
jgi:hypothetical protein